MARKWGDLVFRGEHVYRRPPWCPLFVFLLLRRWFEI